MEKTLYLLSVISCHITLQRRNLWTLPLKSTTVSDTFMTGPVCVDADATRIVSDRRRAQMAVSHDVLNFFNMWQGGFLPLWERLISPLRDKTHWLKTLQLWANCQQECGLKPDQQLPRRQMNTEVLGWPSVKQRLKEKHRVVVLMTIDSGVQYFLSHPLSVSSSLKLASGNLKPTSNWTNSERWERVDSVIN